MPMITQRASLNTADILKRMLQSTQAKKLLRVLWFAAVLVVIVGSLLPSTSLPMRALGSLHVSDKIEHFGAYAVLAFLPALHERKGFVIAAALGAVALGVALEFGQLFSGWRNFEIADMVADAIGVCFGLAAGVLARFKLQAVFLP
jgi:VanZ family protein